MGGRGGRGVQRNSRATFTWLHVAYTWLGSNLQVAHTPKCNSGQMCQSSSLLTHGFLFKTNRACKANRIAMPYIMSPQKSEPTLCAPKSQQVWGPSKHTKLHTNSVSCSRARDQARPSLAPALLVQSVKIYLRPSESPSVAEECEARYAKALPHSSIHCMRPVGIRGEDGCA